MLFPFIFSNDRRLLAVLAGVLISDSTPSTLPAGRPDRFRRRTVYLYRAGRLRAVLTASGAS